MSVRDSFIEHFSAEQADKIMAAAEEHQNGIHDKRGSDAFRWAIAICIGFECMSKDSYRKYHGITVPWDDLRTWIRDHADLANHDGDVDFLSLFCGTYNEFVEGAPKAGA